MPPERLLTLSRGEFEAVDAFSRLDETDDALFYARERCVYHMDARARQTLQRVIETLCVEAEPVILDLMASWHSHIPDTLQPAELVGLGLGETELEQNERLDRYLLHDLNQQPVLPLGDASFDVVLNTASVDYLTRPFEVFAEVARVLKPGGLFLVTFTNRLFSEKAVKLWREADETTRQLIIHEYFRSVPDFGPMKLFCSRGKPRPKDDTYAGLGIPSDPIWAIYAERKGASPGRVPRPAEAVQTPVCIPRPRTTRPSLPEAIRVWNVHFFDPSLFSSRGPAQLGSPNALAAGGSQRLSICDCRHALQYADCGSWE